MAAKRFILLLPMITFGDMDVIRIGGLFDSGNDKQQMAFRYAVDSINSDRKLLTHARLSAQSETVPPNDSFKGSRKACSLLKNGVAAIFGPQSPHTAAHVQSICDAMEVPHIENRWDFRLTRDAYSVNVYPHPASLSKAYRDVVRTLRWKKFCIIYENNNGLVRVQELLQTKFFTVTLRQLPNSHDYRPMFKDVKKSGVKHVVLDVTREKIQTLLKQAQQVGMMSSYHNYFITNLDLHTVDLEDFRHGGTNITGLRIIDPESPIVKRVLSDWGYDPRHFGNVIDLYPHVASTPQSILFSDISPIDLKGNSSFTNGIPSAFAAMEASALSGIKKFVASSLLTDVALMYDAVHLFAKALHDLHRSVNIDTSSLDCNGDLTWIHGNSIINYMKWVEINGLTGLIRFDKEGFRRDISLEIIELWKEGLTKVGRWDSTNGANYTRSYSDIQKTIVRSLKNKTLIVSTLLAAPYTMLHKSSLQMIGNDRYEGFCIDLIHEISKILGFNYTIAIVPDGRHGKFDPKKKRWDGMIWELLSEKADLAIGDLTITFDREQEIDFTMPWMNLGVTILYVKPTRKPPNLFSFLSPLSLDVWLYMATAYLAISVLLFVLARFSPYEWTTPSSSSGKSIDKVSSSDNFTLFNCLWFCIGSLMQQGSDLLPKAISTRIVAGIWWFFTLIMISSYTANLAAFLTVERMDSPIESADDLAKQTKIKYGCMAGGSTWTFFKTSKMPVFESMYNFMEAQRPSVYTASNKEGEDKVLNSDGQYAFLMESSSIEYITERKCQLTQIGGLLDSKSYGIALPQGSPYTNAITGAILSLQENGRLQTLKNRWWKQRRAAYCKDDESKGSSKANELGLNNVGGVFVVLLAGMGLASVVAVFEFVWKSRKLATEAHASVWNEMGKELRCALSCGTPKRSKKSASSTSISHNCGHGNGSTYLPMEAYGSTYTTSQYSFQSKDPKCHHISALPTNNPKMCNEMKEEVSPLPAGTEMGRAPIGFNIDRDLICRMPHAQSLDRLSANLRFSGNSFKSEMNAENLQSPDLPYQLVSGV